MLVAHDEQSNSRRMLPSSVRHRLSTATEPSSRSSTSSTFDAVSLASTQTFASSTMSASTLVETVSINYEDFSESFLTCATCLYPYDAAIHNPKLLSCSHTVCRSCLERIAALPQSRDTGSFRCPICRETICVPRGGVQALPPSFLVNQLIDLMQRQRREVLPKCAAHPSVDLLFCETCDAVFCPACVDSIHTNAATMQQTGATALYSDHTVVPFSIAIKRMSEILLYKANHCVRNLSRATENVVKEMETLDVNVDEVCERVNRSFQELAAQLERRRHEILDELIRIREEKRRILQEQLQIIAQEKVKVERECAGLEYQTEVRNITRKIGELSQQLDVSNTLLEPRENAFVRYLCDPAEVYQGLSKALACVGMVEVSKTFPALCSITIEPAIANLYCRATITTIDYHGCTRLTGGDPVEVTLVKCDPRQSFRPISTPATPATNIDDVVVDDNGDGTYSVRFRPLEAGSYELCVNIFGRPIRGSPFALNVSPHINPIWQRGVYGVVEEEKFDEGELCQPVRVQCGAAGELYVLDTGNNRIKVCTADGTLVRSLVGEALAHQSAIGLVLARSGGAKLYSLNWRSRSVSEWNLAGATNADRSFTCPAFAQPIDIALDERNSRLLVADNLASPVFSTSPPDEPELSSGCRLFVFDVRTFRLVKTVELECPEDGQDSTARRVRRRRYHIACIACGLEPNEVVIGGSFGLRVYNYMTGRFLRAIEFSAGDSSLRRARGTVHGLAVSTAGGGMCFASVTGVAGSPGETMAQISVASYRTGKFLYAIDSFAAKLRRPSGLSTMVDEGGSFVFVADVGSHCVKKYRFL